MEFYVKWKKRIVVVRGRRTWYTGIPGNGIQERAEKNEYNRQRKAVRRKDGERR